MIGRKNLIGGQWKLLLALAGMLAEATPAPADDLARDGIAKRAPQQTERGGPQRDRTFKARLTPHWFASGTRFWYRNDLHGGTREFVLVDAEQGIRKPAFDHARLASALSRAAGVEYQMDRLPFDSIAFIDDVDSKALRFKVGDRTWRCSLDSYECSPTDAVDAATPGENPNEANPQQERRRQSGRRQRDADGSDRSPDGKWTAFSKDGNVFIRSSEGGGEIQLSQDGKEGLAYGRLSWSPDSATLVGFRIEPAERKTVHLIESSPKEGGRAQLRTRPYALPGDTFTSYELNIFDVAGRRVGIPADPSPLPASPQVPQLQVKPAVDRFEHEWEPPRPRWNRDGRRFTYQQTDRGHQRFRVVEVDARAGTARNLIEEKTETFIWSAHTENLRLNAVNWIGKSDEIIYVSERDGWRHLYLIDTKEGAVKTQITKGNWVVRSIERIDEDTRQIWFSASGRNEGQDPYLIHYYRVGFDGTGLVALTDGNGNHAVQYSPDRKYLIDTFSRVDTAPVHELRRVADGALVCRLDEADISELKADGWQPPEVFVAKGRDGVTDIWGIICRPRDFDPNRKYPVIEQIYAGPQSSYVPKTFSPSRRFASLTDLGFIVVQIDGMGTANRSKAFHDVCWKNLKDAGFPDRILWHQAAAARYPSHDLTRVGIYGGSAGGQNAAGAVLFHPEFYKVAAAACGCHDNRMDKASWNEQWMGYPVGPQYAECSNIDNAHRLRGKLLLTVGELDSNVPPESTLRLADALIRAGKDFELVVIPGANHGDGGPYGVRRRTDFFVRHLLGKEPPDRNAN